jgi:hypothetical protein
LRLSDAAQAGEHTRQKGVKHARTMRRSMAD